MIKSYTSRDIKRLLKKKGFVFARCTGGHEVYKKGSELVVVNVHINQAIAQRLVKQYKLA